MEFPIYERRFKPGSLKVSTSPKIFSHGSNSNQQSRPRSCDFVLTSLYAYRTFFLKYSPSSRTTVLQRQRTVPTAWRPLVFFRRLRASSDLGCPVVVAPTPWEDTTRHTYQRSLSLSLHSLVRIWPHLLPHRPAKHRVHCCWSVSMRERSAWT